MEDKTFSALQNKLILDEKYSVPLTMFYEEEMSLAEIAQALRLTRGTVSSRLTRGRQKLKAMLEKEEAL